MAEVDISPLAKRLAEENNVDWRALNGSGDEGRIVERDVLDYLARVMAGDEAANPTPEPLPDGMEQWPDQPPASSDDSALSQSPAEASGADDAWSGDDDLLEVDTGDAGAAQANTADDWAEGGWGDDDWGAVGSGSENSGTAPDEDVFAGIDDIGGNDQEPAAGDGAIDIGASDGQAFDFGSETAEQALAGENESDPGAPFEFEAGSQTDEVSVFDTSSMEPAIDEGIFVFDDEEEAAPAAAGGEEARAEEARAEENRVEEARTEETWAEETSAEKARAEEARAEEDPFGTGGEERAATRPGESSAGEQSDVGNFVAEQSDPEHTPWQGGSASAAEVEEQVAEETEAGESHWEQESPRASDLPASDAPWTAVAEGNGYAESVSEPSGGSTAPSQGMAPDQYAYLDRADDSLPDGVRIEEDEHQVRSPVAGDPVATATAAASRVQRQRSATGVVSGGMVLRRDVDLTALVEARQALSAELDDRGSLAAFLLRAAVRGGRPWPLQNDEDSVGLASLSDEGVRVSVVEAASDASFRDLVKACADTVTSGGQPALAVADVSEMGIDEAVLDLDLPVLTIGRVLEDSDRFHATLTLSGISTPDSGSRFLARVAELLAAPVRLVL